MRVFLSWSGERSKRVSLLLKEWLSCVIQSVHPWVSSKDIDRGSLWFTEISQQLGETSVGVICLTQDNKEKPWILFEAGALAKGLNSSRVCTLLIDLEPKDIGDPLAQFNHTLPTKDGLFDLLRTLNSAADSPLEDKVLERAFETYWPQFVDEFQAILADTKMASTAKPRKSDDVLSEILESTRSMSSRIRKLEELALKGKDSQGATGLGELAMEVMKQRELQETQQRRRPIKLSDLISPHLAAKNPDGEDLP